MLLKHPANLISGLSPTVSNSERHTGTAAEDVSHCLRFTWKGPPAVIPVPVVLKAKRHPAAFFQKADAALLFL